VIYQPNQSSDGQAMCFIHENESKGDFVMSMTLNTAAVIILLGLAAIDTGHARGMHRYHATHHGHLGPPLGYQPQQPMTPQFNDPGPKLWVPQPGNAVEQLSPLMGAGQPDALGIR
jgi:hypothetical protein